MPSYSSEELSRQSFNARQTEVAKEINKMTDALLSGFTENYPSVDEQTFIDYVIPLLQEPHGLEFQKRYCYYVKDIKMPLRVLDMDGKELFTVPPMIPTLNTTIIEDNGTTTASMLFYINKQRSLGISEDAMLKKYYGSLIQAQDYREKVLIPISEILAKYGKSFISQHSTGDVNDVATKAASKTSFTDEYEDE